MERYPGVSGFPATGRKGLPGTWIRFLGEPLDCDEGATERLLGSKAASLHRLKYAGFPSPPAFTITTDACRHYLKANRQWPDGLWDDIQSGMSQLEEATGRKFGQLPRPLTVAVRSGSPNSMPGLLTTLLHCGLTAIIASQIDNVETWAAFCEFLEGYASTCFGRATASRFAKQLCDLPPRARCERWLEKWISSPTGRLPESPDALLRSAITAVFESWQSAQAIRWRQLHDESFDDATAVTVQVMFPSEVSGVAFSRDPLRESKQDAIIVEAAAGLGHRVVGGHLRPVCWLIERQTLAVREMSGPEASGGTAAIADFAEHGLELLSRQMLKIEEVVGAPVDVEFGYAAGEVVFFQARPLQGLASRLDVEEVRQAELMRLHALLRQGRPLWVKHNLAESLPAPTPLTWDLWRQFMTGRGGFGHLYRRLGYRPSRRVGRDGFLELIAGRIYADPHRLTEMFCAGYPFSFDLDALRANAANLDQPPTRLDLERLDPWFLVRWPWVVMCLVKAQWRQPRLRRLAIERFEAEFVPRVRQLVEGERRQDLASLSIPQLIDLFKRRRQACFDEIAPEAFLPGALGAAAWALFEQELKTAVGEALARRSANSILATINDPITSRRESLSHGVASGTIGIDEFVAEFGHRGPGEMDLSSPRWREYPDAVVSAAQYFDRRSPASNSSSETVSKEDDHRTLDECGLKLNRRVRHLLEDAVTLLRYREIGKHEWLRVYDLLRDVVLELCRRSGLGGEIHYLTVAELEGLERLATADQVIAERRQRHHALRQLFVPAVIELDRGCEDFGRAPQLPAEKTIFAASLSNGHAWGKALVITDGDIDPERCNDRIVVAPSIDPASMPMLAGAAAVILEQAGTLSHIALLARRLSIPVVAAEGATSRLVTGDMVYVDADQGRISRYDAVAKSGGDV
jgi:rifampicin phosphotransferase